jgi:hypothetical protein
VAEVSELPATSDARKAYQAAKARQRPYLTPSDRPVPPRRRNTGTRPDQEVS